jgi:hypothetical protein
MSKCLLVFLLALGTGGLFAENFKTNDGKEYKNVTVSRVETDGIVLITSAGISKVYFAELPREVQERFQKKQAPTLPPRETYFLTRSTSVIKDGALIGLHAGTVVKRLRDDGGTLHVAWEGTELDVDKQIVTNDPTVAAAAVANDQQAQAALGAWTDEQRNPSSSIIDEDVTRSKDVYVEWAFYGSHSQDKNVTDVVRSLPRWDTTIQVSNKLFDSTSTTDNTLFVIFYYKGQDYQIELRDGEPLSFANAKAPKPTPQEEADAYRIWDGVVAPPLFARKVNREIAALYARLRNTPESQRNRAETAASIKEMEELGKRTERAVQNSHRIMAEQAENARQASASTNYEATERARTANIQQYFRLDSEIQHLDSYKQLREKNDQNTREVTRQIDEARRLQNSLWPR